MVKIFYVEDEPFLAKIVKESLESRAYSVTLVSDGGNARGVFNSDDFDICILDIMLPNISGYDIAKDIRALDPNMPILFLTAKDQTEDVIKGFEVGGNDYIKKPFSMEELIVRIDNLLKLSIKISDLSKAISEIPIGSHFIFMPDRFLLKSNTQKITLSHRESQILAHLCKAKTKSIDRKTILKDVWGDDSISNSRNLDVYITKLRNHLKEDHTIKIMTLKGFGYQLIIDN